MSDTKALIEFIKTIPTKDNPFGFNLDGIETGADLLTEAEKTQLIARIEAAQLSKEGARRILAAVSGALKLAVLVI